MVPKDPRVGILSKYKDWSARQQVMFRFQYSVMTKASRRIAWQVFSNWQRWNEFANIYGEVEWREGRPWEAGSRLEIEVLEPVKTVVSHVITNCQPGQRLGWIDHSLGVVLAQWVSFEEHARKGTRVHTWGDIVHSGVKIAGRTAEQVITSFTETWYENFRSTCDQLAETSGDGAEEQFQAT
jgi:hypothetical protein